MSVAAPDDVLDATALLLPVLGIDSHDSYRHQQSDRIDEPAALLQRRGGDFGVEIVTLPAREEARVEGSSHHDGDVPPRQGRKGAIQCCLVVDERVLASQQHDVRVGDPRLCRADSDVEPVNQQHAADC